MTGIACREAPCAPQAEFDVPPYDTWREPGGTVVAQFHRVAGGIVVRFPETVDFRIALPDCAVTAVPVSPASVSAAKTLFANSIVPLVANYRGGLFLHGSAVQIGGRAVAFLGVSRSGKTTLAGAFARAGHPFLTEDAIELEAHGDGYRVVPKDPVLRLFPDSTAFLGADGGSNDGLGKATIKASASLPASDRRADLAAIYLLAASGENGVAITPVPPSEALAGMLQHAFVLDVEDRARLEGHFARLADLAGRVRVGRLDYPRRYDALPLVIQMAVDDLNPSCESGA